MSHSAEWLRGAVHVAKDCEEPVAVAYYTKLLAAAVASEASRTNAAEQLRAAHDAIMPHCCPGPEAWPDGQQWWQVASEKLATLLAILRAGKDDRWAAVHGSDEGGFAPTEWVLAAERVLAGNNATAEAQPSAAEVIAAAKEALEIAQQASGSRLFHDSRRKALATISAWEVKNDR